MSRKVCIRLAILVLSPVIISILWPTDESKIKKLFREGAKAIEQEKIDEVMAKVSFNYADEYGFTYLYLKEGMMRLFQRLEGIKVEYEIAGITINDDRATAEVAIRVVASHGNDTGYAVGDAAKPERVTFSLDKDRATWLVTKTSGLALDF